MTEVNTSEGSCMPSTPTKDDRNFTNTVSETRQVRKFDLNLIVEGDDVTCNMEENLDAFRPGEAVDVLPFQDYNISEVISSMEEVKDSKVTEPGNMEEVDTMPNPLGLKRKRVQQVPKIRKHRPKVVKDKLMEDIAPRTPKCTTPKKKSYVKGKKSHKKKLEPACKKILNYKNEEEKVGGWMQKPKSTNDELVKYLQVVPRKFRSKSRYMSRVLGKFRGIILELRPQTKKKRSKIIRLGCRKTNMDCSVHVVAPEDGQIQEMELEPSHHPQTPAETEHATKESIICHQSLVEVSDIPRTSNMEDEGVPSVEVFLIKGYLMLGLTNNVNIRKKARKKAWTQSEKLMLASLIMDPMREKTENDAIVLYIDSLCQIKEQAREKERLKEQMWQKERSLFSGRVKFFISYMRLLQGEREFKQWKGSVIDSIVGVFLTQNVSDYLSGNAYMCVAARYPPLQCGRNYNVSYEDVCDDQKLGGSNIVDVVKEFEDFKDSDDDGDDVYDEQEPSVTSNLEKKESEEKISNKDANTFTWDSLRKMHNKQEFERHCDTMDSVDWNAVRLAPLQEFASTIMHRGQHMQIGRRIQNFLNWVEKEHGSLDLEWLKYVPDEKVKEYLLSISGIGLKSVECIRLLALRQVAFPVDVNVQRIAVRLGWVPLQPLPGGIEIHVLEQYPMLEHVQKYLWPRLCTLDHEILYELHYQMITFGKIFCKKKNPNCDACPFKGHCKHYANEVARKNALPGPGPKRSKIPVHMDISSVISTIQSLNKIPSYLPLHHQCAGLATGYPTTTLGSISELLAMKQVLEVPESEHIVEMPSSPELPDKVATTLHSPRPSSYAVTTEMDMEDLCKENSREMIEFQPQRMTEQELEDLLVFRKMVLSTAQIFPPPAQLKVVSKHKTEHYVYELPDYHPILARHKFEHRECNDVNPYLLAICEMASTFQDERPLVCDSPWEQSSQLLYGTILIPCRTAVKGFFPLNGTYFQINEVFADHESSRSPIEVRSSELSDLRRTIVTCGTSPSAMSKGLSMEEIRRFFLAGFICIRAFDRHTKAPHRLADWLHKYTTATDRVERRQQKEIERKRKEMKSKLEEQINDLPVDTELKL